MLKRALSLLAFGFLVPGCQLQPCYQVSGPLTEWEYGISEFQRIRVLNAPELHIEQGHPQTVVVESEQNMFQTLQFHIDPNEKLLIIEFDEDCVDNIDHFKIFITLDSLKALDLRGGGEVWLDDTLITERLDVSITGTVDVHIDHLEADVVKTDISGSGTIRATSGSFKVHELNVAGIGSFFGYGIQTENTQIDVSGGSVVQTSVSDSLRVSVSGTADVYYKGQPVIEQNITGNGQVIDAN